MKYILITLSLAGLAFSTPTSPLAPLSKRGEVIDDSYIVVLKKDVNPQQMALHLAGLEEWHSADVRLSLFSFSSSLSLAAQGRSPRRCVDTGLPRGVTPFGEGRRVQHPPNLSSRPRLERELICSPYSTLLLDQR
jgi:hypothetical protein